MMKTKIILKRTISILLVVVIFMSLVACNKKRESIKKLNIALILDAGGVEDYSFNYSLANACIKWSEQNDAVFNCYTPYNTYDDIRRAIDHAVSIGAGVIILPSYMFSQELIQASKKYPSTKFVGMDTGETDILSSALGDQYSGNPDDYNIKEYYNHKNTYLCTYQEEISGYLAGYCAVALGNRHLGFVGGIDADAVKRYGYGYLQGINDAAKKFRVEDEVEVEYVYCGVFSSNYKITQFVTNWYYNKHVDVVFSCGGAICNSVAEAANKFHGKMIGVDTDQKENIENKYKNVNVITSAMKGLDVTVSYMLEAIANGQWDKHAGKIENLGLVSKKVENNFVKLPINSTQWGKGFKQEDYFKLVSDLYKGKVKVSSKIEKKPKVKINVNYYSTIVKENE